MTIKTRLTRLTVAVSERRAFADPGTPLEDKLNRMAAAFRINGIPEISGDMSIAETVAAYMAENEVTL